MVLSQRLNACAMCFAAFVFTQECVALARVSPLEMTSLIDSNYAPQDKDERGLWQSIDRLEEELIHSNIVLRDQSVNRYVSSILERLLQNEDHNIRLYIVHDASFNASMFPNGLMIVHTGLLARVHSEAQLAAVLGHELGHYLRQHTLSNWRSIKTKSAIAAFITVGAGVASGLTRQNWFELSDAISGTLILSMFSYSRSLESEADAFGLRLLAEANYNLSSASTTWAQLTNERRASAQVRNKRYRDKAHSAFSTHPPAKKRMRDLNESTLELADQFLESIEGEAGRERWIGSIAPIRAMLIEEQIKLNDPGASLYLLGSHASDGWDGTLRYFEGEVYRLRNEEGDEEKALIAFTAAVLFSDCPPEAYKSYGYSLLKIGRTDEADKALNHYLELKPDAPDAAMVRMSISYSYDGD